MKTKNIRKANFIVFMQIVIWFITGIFAPSFVFSAEINEGSYNSSGKVYWDGMTADTTFRWL